MFLAIKLILEIEIGEHWKSLNQNGFHSSSLTANVTTALTKIERFNTGFWHPRK
jgi:hypothetical protein